MTKRTQAPYGSWQSPITADLLVKSTVGLQTFAAATSDMYWIESRAVEKGRCVVVHRSSAGDVTDLTPAPFNTRTRAHEYGGGACTVADGIVYATHYGDNLVYRHESGLAPTPLTADSAMYFADFVYDHAHVRLICVREDHTVIGEAVNALVSVPTDGSCEIQILASGHDFYSSPTISPDGKHLAWLSWDHPNMPWDGTELWLADVMENGQLTHKRLIAGGKEESIFQPQWSPDGVLHFISDRSNWWNLYRLEADTGQVSCILAKEAEFGRPQWVFGMSTYAFTAAQEIVCAYNVRGLWRLGQLNCKSGALTEIITHYTEIAGLRATAGSVIMEVASPTTAQAIARYTPATGHVEEIRVSSTVEVNEDDLSLPEAIEFPTTEGKTAFGFFYPPKNAVYDASPNERPPLIVYTHGGPTSSASTARKLPISFWTSRGFAILDVNYGGSTGYGRQYRLRLSGQWGVVDVDDCEYGALYLVRRGDADAQRLAIRGGSAGGYTTLAALTFRDTFRAGASYYGVSNIEMLAQDTHKFESRYLDSLIGPYPEAKELYDARSPLLHADRLSCPVILFQGLDDKIVLPNQSEQMVAALRKKGVPVAYLPLEGEGHGFRRAENITRTLEAELYFYAQIFDIELADDIAPIAIENLP